MQRKIQRRKPQEDTEDIRKKNRWKKRRALKLGKWARTVKRAALGLFACCVILLSALFIYTVTKDHNYFELSFYQVESEKISNKMRIVQLSDLHLKEFGENNSLLVDKIRQLKPDLIALTGDMNNQDDPDYSVVITLCEQLTEIAPVYYSYGNHEIDNAVLGDKSLKTDLENVGVKVLDDQSEVINVNGNDVKIGGLTESPEFFDKYSTRFWSSYTEGDEFKICLIHYPEYFLEKLADEPVDLVLAGHTHGAVMRIPGIGGLYAPDQGFFPQLSEGLHKINDINLVVSRGLGDTHLRINNPSELVVVDVNWY